MPQAASAHDTFWDFISLMPESMHMIMWVMSDRAIPRSLRMMEGFGVHTFRLVNAKGKSRFVKFHWKPLLGVHSVVWDEAQKISGKDPDFHRRDLWEAIESGNFPEWELGVQVVEEEDENAFAFDLLDPTKLIPEELVPVQRIGRLTLNRNPDNFFAETEQVAFHPGHVVPGIDFTNDPAPAGPPVLLHRHPADAARRSELPRDPDQPPGRAGPQPPARRPTCGRRSTKGAPPTSRTRWVGGCPMQAGAAAGGFVSFPERLSGEKVRGRSEKFFDHFSQATLFWNSQSDPEKDHIVLALRFELGKLETPAIRERMVGMLDSRRRDAGLAGRRRAGNGLDSEGRAAAEPQLPRGRRSRGVSAARGPRQGRDRALRRPQHGQHGQGHDRRRARSRSSLPTASMRGPGADENRSFRGGRAGQGRRAGAGRARGRPTEAKCRSTSVCSPRRQSSSTPSTSRAAKDRRPPCPPSATRSSSWRRPIATARRSARREKASISFAPALAWTLQRALPASSWRRQAKSLRKVVHQRDRQASSLESCHSGRSASFAAKESAPWEAKKQGLKRCRRAGVDTPVCHTME